MSDQKPLENSPGVFVQILRDATPFEMGLVAFVIFPAIFLAWSPILKELLPNQASLRTVVLLIGYVMLIGLMLRGKVVAEQIKRLEKASEFKAEKRRQELESAKCVIYSWMADIGYTKSSYDRLRQKLGKHESEWSNDFLNDVVGAYPALFRYQQIRGGKPGLRLLNSVEVDEDL